MSFVDDAVDSLEGKPKVGSHHFVALLQTFAHLVNTTSVSKRYIERKGVAGNGSYRDPSNNADAYSVIEKGDSH